MKDIDGQGDILGASRGAAAPLARITQPPRLAGVVICLDHLSLLRDLAQREAHLYDDQERPAFLHIEIPWSPERDDYHQCLMCGVKASAHRRCENDSCARELHPQWPAVYCCNECAWEDACPRDRAGA